MRVFEFLLTKCWTLCYTELLQFWSVMLDGHCRGSVPQSCRALVRSDGSQGAWEELSKWDYLFSIFPPAKIADFLNPKSFARLYIMCFLLQKLFLLVTSDCSKYSCCLVRLGSYYCSTCFRSDSNQLFPHFTHVPHRRYQPCRGRACLCCWSRATQYEQSHLLYVKRGQDTLPLKAFS